MPFFTLAIAWRSPGFRTLKIEYNINIFSIKHNLKLRFIVYSFSLVTSSFKSPDPRQETAIIIAIFVANYHAPEVAIVFQVTRRFLYTWGNCKSEPLFPSFFHSNTSMPEETGWRKPSWKRVPIWSPSNMLSAFTLNLQMPWSRNIYAPKPLKVRSSPMTGSIRFSS